MALEQFFYDNPNPCWIYECQKLHFIEVNKSCVSLYGYTEEEFLYKLTINDLQPKEDQLLMKDYLEEDNTFGDAGIWRHKDKKGKLFHVLIFSHETRLNGQKCRYVMAVNVEKELQNERSFRDIYVDRQKLQQSIRKRTGPKDRGK